MAKAKATLKKSKRQTLSTFDPLDQGLNELCQKVEKTAWRRAAEEGFIENIRNAAEQGDPVAIAALEVHSALERVAIVHGWRDAAIGEMAQFVASVYESMWGEGPAAAGGRRLGKKLEKEAFGTTSK